MNLFFNDLRIALRKQAAYNRTIRELRGMGNAVSRDLDLFPADARSIARKAVYGY